MQPFQKEVGPHFLYDAPIANEFAIVLVDELVANESAEYRLGRGKKSSIFVARSKVQVIPEVYGEGDPPVVERLEHEATAISIVQQFSQPRRSASAHAGYERCRAMIVVMVDKVSDDDVAKRSPK
jgi:hypothetical protein